MAQCLFASRAKFLKHLLVTGWWGEGGGDADTKMGCHTLLLQESELEEYKKDVDVLVMERDLGECSREKQAMDRKIMQLQKEQTQLSQQASARGALEELRKQKRALEETYRNQYDRSCVVHVSSFQLALIVLYLLTLLLLLFAFVVIVVIIHDYVVGLGCSLLCLLLIVFVVMLVVVCSCDYCCIVVVVSYLLFLLLFRLDSVEPDLLSLFGTIPSESENVGRKLEKLLKDKERELQDLSNRHNTSSAQRSRLQTQQEQLE